MSNSLKHTSTRSKPTSLHLARCSNSQTNVLALAVIMGKIEINHRGPPCVSRKQISVLCHARLFQCRAPHASAARKLLSFFPPSQIVSLSLKLSQAVVCFVCHHQTSAPGDGGFMLRCAMRRNARDQTSNRLGSMLLCSARKTWKRGRRER